MVICRPISGWSSGKWGLHDPVATVDVVQAADRPTTGRPFAPARRPVRPIVCTRPSIGPLARPPTGQHARVSWSVRPATNPPGAIPSARQPASPPATHRAVRLPPYVVTVADRQLYSSSKLCVDHRWIDRRHRGPTDGTGNGKTPDSFRTGKMLVFVCEIRCAILMCSLLNNITNYI